MARLKQHLPDGDPRIDEAVRELAAIRLEEVIRRELATSPPLTPDQLNHLANLIATPKPNPHDVQEDTP